MYLRYKKYHQMSDKQMQRVSMTPSEMQAFEDERSKLRDKWNGQVGKTMDEIIDRCPLIK